MLLLLLVRFFETGADLNVTKKIIEISLATSLLSEILFLPQLYTNPSEGYDSFELFTMEPDVSVVAKKGGFCYGVARATTASIADQRQNFGKDTRVICSEQDETNCCTAHKGWSDAYNNSFREEFETALRDCAATCDDADECVVLGGMSQGAAIASVASVFLKDLNPYVVLLGQPETLHPDCAAIDPYRHYNYVNSGISGKWFPKKINYDKTFMKDYENAMHYGHIILLSDDPSAVAYLGMNSHDRFPSSKGFRTGNAHTLRKLPGFILGYSERFERILKTYSNFAYPVKIGFSDGFYCTKDIECRGFCLERGFPGLLPVCSSNRTR